MFLKCLRKGFNEIGIKTKLFKFRPTNQFVYSIYFSKQIAWDC